MRKTSRKSIPTLSAAICATLLSAFALQAFAFSNNPAGLTGRTNKDGGSGCVSCHGAAADSSMSVMITGPSTLAPNATATYMVQIDRTGTADGTRTGVAVASSDAGSLANASGMPTTVSSGEVIHDSNAGTLRTMTSGTSMYQFQYTMPPSATAGSTHTLYAVAAYGNPGGWKHASNFTVTTSGSTPPPSGDPKTVMLDPSVTQMANGDKHSCALTALGTVKCWGQNSNGQLGIGSTNPNFSYTALDVPGLSGVAAISAGGNHTCVLMANGTVKCWGTTYGGLSNNAPTDISGLTGVAAIASGFQHTCALTTGGAVKCFGRNDLGQLGNNTTTDSPAPVDVSGLASGVTGLASGQKHSCAVLAGGGAKCWGQNTSGQLGDNSTTNRSTPVDVSGLTGVASLGAGWGHTCAVTTAGAAKCWGQNDRGQLGNGSTTNSSTPADVSSLGTGVSHIAGGENHTCALLTAGGVKCWGQNNDSQLGDGTTSQRTSPVDVNGEGGTGTLAGVKSITVGSRHSCAQNLLGGERCWGYNDFGQVGDGTNGNRQSPVNVVGLALGITAFDAGLGNTHACAVTPAGGVKCWGQNNDGQLGDGTTTNSSTPVDVKGPGGVGLLFGATAVGTGNRHSCALVTGGEVHCWGYNGDGQLGNNTNSNSASPVSVKYPDPNNTSNIITLTGVQSLSVGRMHTCIRKNSEVKCWGLNSAGQLGDGTTTSRNRAVDVTGLSSITHISAGGEHTCALNGVSAFTVRCWGSNTFGQLGNGSSGSNSTTPVTAINASTTNVAAIAAGGQHTCAVVGSGVKCWGRNNSGQVGDSSTSDRNSPTDVASLSGAAGISAGESHSCARTSSGAMKCWGSNASGELGNNSNTQSTTPVDVTGLASGASDTTAGSGFTCALVDVATVPPGVLPSASRALKCWGANNVGQLGDGTMTPRMSPVDILRSQSIATTFPASLIGEEMLTGTAGSGLPVSFDSWTPGICTVASNKVTVSTSGMCGLRASQSGNGNNARAPQQLKLIGATFTPRFALNVSKTGTGSGTVTSADSLINCGATCSANYIGGTGVTLTATPAAGSAFTGWSGGGCSGTGMCTVTMNAVTNVTATFTQVTFALTVNKTGSGTVTSTPAGINCGATCSANFNSGTSVSLSAAPDGSSVFTGWGGACSGTGACNVTMDAAKTVNATFSANVPRLVNIATRGRVQTGANVLIAGFIIGGSTPKKVLVTARGPSVAVLPSEVPLLLADPKLTLYSGASPIDSNDDWKTRANFGDIPTDKKPGNDKDAAILTTLNPGAYTAIVEGVGGATGLAIVEVFEIDNPSIPLLNIATRGKVEGGANVMIAGFYIDGTANKTVLVTARGQSVAVLPSEVPLLMADPKITLFNSGGPFESNDDWQSRANSVDIPSTQKPGHPKDAAILINLPPGPYTAIVEGVSGSTGIAIVEVFAQ